MNLQTRLYQTQANEATITEFDKGVRRMLHVMATGTGKTIVALHRAVNLVRKHAEVRVLLTFFSETLASALRVKLRRLLGNEPRLGERVEIHSMNAAAKRLYRAQFGGSDPRLAMTSGLRSGTMQFVLRNIKTGIV